MSRIKIIIGCVFIGVLVIIVIICLSLIPTTKATPISEEVYFYHFARDRPNKAIELKTGEKLDTTINPKLPWKFFVHGFTTNPAVSPWFHTGKAEYFLNGEYNVVFVDWSKPTNQLYLLSVKNAMDVGKFFGKFIIHLSENGVSLDDVHLLGHSLGSHMVGHTGKYVRDNVEKIGRITGLDPALPFYEPSTLLNQEALNNQYPRIYEEIRQINPHIGNQEMIVPENLRLSKNDAKFVDIIHTDATHFGILTSIGHSDFFANSGLPIQPGCENTGDDNCSHARSVKFFVESINLNNFVSTECPSYKKFVEGLCKNSTKAMMGEHADHNTRGIFHLKTKSSPPFGLGNV